MSKSIRLSRAELTWVYYDFVMEERDWLNFVNDYKAVSENFDLYWRKRAVYMSASTRPSFVKKVYEDIKNLTWEQVIEDFNKDESEQIHWEDAVGDGIAYDVSLSTMLKNYMREASYEGDYEFGDPINNSDEYYVDED